MPLSINTQLVTPVAGAKIETGTCGQAIAIGQSVAKLTDGNWYLANAAGNAAIAGSGGLGIALSASAASGQKFLIFRRGQINLGATLTEATVITLCNTAGGLDVTANLTQTNNYLSIMGAALNTSFMQTGSDGMFATGAQVA